MFISMIANQVSLYLGFLETYGGSGLRKDTDLGPGIEQRNGCAEFQVALTK